MKKSTNLSAIAIIVILFIVVIGFQLTRPPAPPPPFTYSITRQTGSQEEVDALNYVERFTRTLDQTWDAVTFVTRGVNYINLAFIEDSINLGQKRSTGQFIYKAIVYHDNLTLTENFPDLGWFTFNDPIEDPLKFNYANDVLVNQSNYFKHDYFTSIMANSDSPVSYNPTIGFTSLLDINTTYIVYQEAGGDTSAGWLYSFYQVYFLDAKFNIIYFTSIGYDPPVS